jgi:hypothetical protein
MTDFSFERKTWSRGHYGEVLRDGKPFWDEFPPAKSGFQFGPTKAALIIIFIEEIKAFVNSGGELPSVIGGTTVVSINGRELKWHPRFKTAAGGIEHPYLELNYRRSSIRFGMTKARALLSFQKELLALASAK